MKRVSTKTGMRGALSRARATGARIGFVPTMGALHAGHLSLVEAAGMRADVVVASIFVNPTQFGPGEDFDAYPRRIETDTAALGDAGVDLVFTPDSAQMYGDGPLVTVDPGPIALRWEGEVRPEHFRGVATIVAKLLGVVRPDVAFFGEKDYQQLQLVQRLAIDLELGCEIVGCPTVRDPDGLALSSRNAYLNAEERAAALALPAALAAAAQAHANGERDGSALEAAMRDTIARLAGDAVALDYAAVVDPATLEPLAVVDGGARALIAGRIGATRLIDNRALAGEG